ASTFDLAVQITDPTPIPPIDLCNDETLDITGGGTFTGMVEETQDDYSMTCNSVVGSRDAAYFFSIDSTKHVTLVGSSTGGGFGSTFVSLTEDCSTTAEQVACVSSTSSTTLRRRDLPAGDYYVLLESSRTDATGWSLNVDISDPGVRAPGDVC